jgi:hypothetical protein
LWLTTALDVPRFDTISAHHSECVAQPKMPVLSGPDHPAKLKIGVLNPEKFQFNL